MTDEALIGLTAYLMWEEAGSPDGTDFGEKAKALLGRATDAGVWEKEIKNRIENKSLGPTLAARLGLEEVPQGYRYDSKK